MALQSPDTQLQSAFITCLPRENRDKIYLELWRSCGLRQHIIWHHDKDDVTKSHFCRWSCTTPFEVQGKLQAYLDAKRQKLGITTNVSFTDKTSALQLYSTWKNHFACGERIAEVHGEKASPGVGTCSSRGSCWVKNKPNTESSSVWSSYLGILLSCKAISSECIKSIYESTTFIFTDVIALNLFVGFCKVPEFQQQGFNVAIPPPAIRTFGRNMELSLEPVFPMLLPCSSPMMTLKTEERHACLDFHGLCLDRLENLNTLNIWISARCTVLLLDRQANNIDQSPYNITQLSIESLKKVLAPLSHVKNITISMPLEDDTGVEDGYVVNSTPLKIWRRGSGDRFHPSLLPVFDVERFSSLVHFSTDRYVGANCTTTTGTNLSY
ncbi:hypothetical protein EDB82DRAFT_510958 [Fusarium venenatum]|uniref:uncharacterized protein n=1 Tax=Fusarium venenatum TaxID=56646 RepID=UPI001D1A9CDF|nr:hypothetical protein EDB82DRAFT_510958 [Fusarium venenatum]